MNEKDILKYQAKVEFLTCTSQRDYYLKDFAMNSNYLDISSSLSPPSTRSYFSGGLCKVKGWSC